MQVCATKIATTAATHMIVTVTHTWTNENSPKCPPPTSVYSLCSTHNTLIRYLVEESIKNCQSIEQKPRHLCDTVC